MTYEKQIKILEKDTFGRSTCFKTPPKIISNNNNNQ